MSAASAVHAPGHAHLPALVQAAVIAHGPRTALTEEVEGGGWRRISYAEMGRRVDDIAAGLVRAGVGPRDRVAIFAANCAS